MSVNFSDLTDGPNGFPNPANFVNCTLEICPIFTSYYNYRIDLAANAFFLAFFALSVLIYIGIWIYSRRGIWFTLFMVAGLVTEAIGYVGRIISYHNQWSYAGFLTQLICLTLGPAFVSAAIYLCLGRIVIVYGKANSRIPPNWYLYIFMPCDCVSMILQAAAAGVTSTELTANQNINPGTDVFIAGLVFQVFTLFIFMCMSIDFGLRVRRRSKKFGAASALTQDPRLVAVRNSRAFQGFMAALGLAAVTVFWRCAFRVAELDDGWIGPVTYHQGLFIGFESVMIVVAVAALAAFHPSLCMGAAFQNLEERIRAEMTEGGGAGGLLDDRTPNGTTPVEAQGGQVAESSASEK